MARERVPWSGSHCQSLMCDLQDLHNIHLVIQNHRSHPVEMDHLDMGLLVLIDSNDHHDDLNPVAVRLLNRHVL